MNSQLRQLYGFLECLGICLLSQIRRHHRYQLLLVQLPELVLEQEGEEEATDFIITALIEYRRLTTGVDEQTALDWVESKQFQADYVAASQALAQGKV